MPQSNSCWAWRQASNATHSPEVFFNSGGEIGSGIGGGITFSVRFECDADIQDYRFVSDFR